MVVTPPLHFAAQEGNIEKVEVCGEIKRGRNSELNWLSKELKLSLDIRCIPEIESLYWLLIPLVGVVMLPLFFLWFCTN